MKMKMKMKIDPIDVRQYYEYALDSKYARVLNILGLHMVLNKVLRNRYLTGL